MLPSSRRSKGPKDRERSPFSSPNSNLHASPIAVRRSSLEERRRPAAKFEHGISPSPADRVDEEYNEGDDEEEEDPGEDAGEDEAGELSPLLPIFSAAQLGKLNLCASWL